MSDRNKIFQNAEIIVNISVTEKKHFRKVAKILHLSVRQKKLINVAIIVHLSVRQK